jgi:hypothetical protein
MKPRQSAHGGRQFLAKAGSVGVEGKGYLRERRSNYSGCALELGTTARRSKLERREAPSEMDLRHKSL